MPLRLRRSDLQYPNAGWPASDDRLVVLRGDTVIGSLRRIEGGPGHDNWSWSITALYVRPGALTMHGMAETKEAAIAGFTKTLRAWLAHGGENETAEVVARHGFGSRRR